jgi:hypothetical protein
MKGYSMNKLQRIKLVIIVMGIFLGGSVKESVQRHSAVQPKNYRVETVVVTKAQHMPYQGLYLGDGILVCKDVAVCMHELGHMVDDVLGGISYTKEFQDTVDEYHANNPCDYPYSDGTTKCMVANWDGLYGNPLREGDWGGYSELYASLWSTFTTRNNFPEEFKPFFLVINP